MFYIQEVYVDKIFGEIRNQKCSLLRKILKIFFNLGFCAVRHEYCDVTGVENA